MLCVSIDVCSDHWIECQYGWNHNNVVPSTRASAEVLHIHTFLNTDKPNEFSKVTVLFLGEDNSEKENLETQSGFGVQRALTRSCFLTLLYSWCLRGQIIGAKRDLHPINSSNRQHVVLLWKLFTGQFWPFSTVKSILLHGELWSEVWHSPRARITEQLQMPQTLNLCSLSEAVCVWDFIVGSFKAKWGPTWNQRCEYVFGLCTHFISIHCSPQRLKLCLQEVDNFEISEAEFRMPISNYTKIKGEWVMHSSVCAPHGIKNIFSIEHNYSLPEAPVLFD